MSFDVRATELELNRHILCEASAGTGKTFTIEHLFIRRLLTPLANGQRLTVRDIAVLTFTKAVARELVLRLKRALDRAIFELKSSPVDGSEYLLQIVDPAAKKEAINCLEQARVEIDFALIGTIHSFCYRTLTEYATGKLQAQEQRWASSLEIRRAVEDYFRQDLVDDPVLKQELIVLLESEQHNFSECISQIQNKLWDNHPSESDPDGLLKLATKGLLPEQVVAELEQVSVGYKNVRTKEGELKEGIYDSFVAFSRLFCQNVSRADMATLIASPLYASKIFKEKKVKAQVVPSRALELACEYEHMIHELAHPDAIKQRLASRCQPFVKRQLEERGLFCREALVEQMEEALRDRAFLAYMKKRFSCLIVDEFQDTDPRQWKIIQDLYVSDWKGTLYFVGDPKQAIYSFRSADVYSYMQAKCLPDQSVVTLTGNFRSSPALVQALNLLFVGEHSKRLFYLPKLQESLKVLPVTSHAKRENLEGDERGAIHFFIGEEVLGRGSMWPTKKLENECFFPFMAKEMVRLKASGIAFHDMAILVKDRFQAERLSDYLKRRGVPAVRYRSKTVVGTEAHNLLCRLLKAVLVPKDKAALKELLLHRPFSYSSDQLTELEDLMLWAKHVTLLHELQEVFKAQGLTGMVQQFLQTYWQSNHTVKELLWNDKQLLYDLSMLVEYATTEENDLDRVLEYLYSLYDLPDREKEELLSHGDPHEEAALLMTLHASKGLEFDIVFGLHLVGRTKEADDPAEADAEKVRQFYVGCTRAKRRLYLPCAYQADLRPLTAGTSSPMELFLASFEKEQPLEWLVEQSKGTITVGRVIPDLAETLLYHNDEPQKAPLLLESLHVAQTPLFVESYSSIKEQAEHVPKDEVESGLPLGMESGILLHQLLREAIEKKEERQIDKRLRWTIFEGHEEMVETMLKRALSVSLGDFSLNEVDLSRAFCEREFFLRLEEGRFLRGAIDLAFVHQGVSYLLDWKSNALSDYSEASLLQEIKRHEYDLQAKLYTAAWKEQIKASQMPFGGFFFVFLRGLTEATAQGVIRL